MLQTRMTAFLQGAAMTGALCIAARLLALRGLWISQAVALALVLCAASAFLARAHALRGRLTRRLSMAGAAAAAAVAGALACLVGPGLSPAATVIWLVVLFTLLWLCRPEGDVLRPFALGLLAGALCLWVLGLARVGADHVFLAALGLFLVGRISLPVAGALPEPAAGGEAPPLGILMIGGLRSACMGIALGGLVWSFIRQFCVAYGTVLPAMAAFLLAFVPGLLAGALLVREARSGIRKGWQPALTALLLATSSLSFLLYPWVAFSEAALLQTAPRFLIAGRYFLIFPLCLAAGALTGHTVLRRRGGATDLSEGALPWLVLSVAVFSLIGRGDIGVRLTAGLVCCLAVAGLDWLAARRAGASSVGPAVAAASAAVLLIYSQLTPPLLDWKPTRYAMIQYLAPAAYRLRYAPAGAVDRIPALDEVRTRERRLLPDGMAATVSSSQAPDLAVYGGAVMDTTEGRAEAPLRLLAHLPFAVRPATKKIGILAPASPLAVEGLATHLAGAGLKPDDQACGIWAVEGSLRHAALPVQPFVRTGAVPLLDAVVIDPRAVSMHGDACVLYSRQAMRRAAAMVEHGGSLACWLPTRGVTPESLASMLAAIRSALPCVHVFTAGDDLVVLAGRQAIEIQWSAAETPWRSPEVQAWMGRSGYWSVGSVFAGYTIPPAGVDLIADSVAPLGLYDARAPRLRRDLSDVSRPECIILAMQFRKLAREDLSRLFKFGSLVEKHVFLKGAQDGFDEVTRRQVSLVRRLNQFREAEVSAFLSTGLFHAELLGVAPDAPPLMREAAAYEYLGIYEKALTTLHRMGTLGPLTPDAWYRMGTNYAAMGKPDKARECFVRGLKERPDDARTLLALARLDLAAGNGASAENCIVNALKVAPKDVWGLMTLSRIYGKRGQYREAAALLKRVLEIDPENEQAAAELSLYLKAKNEGDQKP